jgi:hypothetical protein
MEPVASVLAIGVFGLLAISAAMHAFHFGGFIQVLKRQRIWPNKLLRPLAIAVVGTEATIAISGFILFLGTDSALPSRASLLGAAILLLSYAVFQMILLARRSNAPCGCSLGDEPADFVSLARTVGAALAAAFAAEQLTRPPSIEPAQIAIVVVAGLCFSIASWILPSALSLPGWQEQVGRNEL